LNPDNVGQPAPVVVRYYQLSDVEPFNHAGFYPLYDQDENTLKQTLLSRGETLVPPGGSRTVEVELSPATRAIGIVVAFRDVRNAIWRATRPIDRPKPGPPKSATAPSIALTFKLNENSVAIAALP
jgi:type VI secretion system protein VasD